MDLPRRFDLSRPLSELHPNEQLKFDSRYLRGTLEQSLEDAITGAISDDDTQLTKFFGIYQQDDRELREERRRARLEPLYQFMVRVRLPGGVCTTEQWLALDALARENANGTLRLTTRQTFQFHGVFKDKLRRHVQGIFASGLDTIAACGDVNRNVIATANPLFSNGHREATETAQRIGAHLLPRTSAYREILLRQPGTNEASAGTPADGTATADAAVSEEPIYGHTYLPRKFKIAIAVPPHNDIDVYAHDLGLIAIVEGGHVVGYNVLVGGGMGMTHRQVATYPRLGDVAGFCEAADVIDVVEHTMCIQRDYGDRHDRYHARFKYTIEDRGIEWFREELARRLGKPLQAARDFHFDTSGDHYGWQQGEDGRWHYTLFIENGRVADTPGRTLMSGLREIATSFPGFFALTTNQNVTIAGIDAADRERLEEILRRHNIENDASHTGLRRHSMACVAFPTCGLAMAESERYLPSLIDRLDEALRNAGLAQEPISIRMTGCPNGCARPYLAEIALVGKAPGKYNLYLGASANGDRMNTLYRENIDERQILAALTPLFDSYAAERQPQERFGDFVIRKQVVPPMLAGRDFQKIEAVAPD